MKDLNVSHYVFGDSVDSEIERFRLKKIFQWNGKEVGEVIAVSPSGHRENSAINILNKMNETSMPKAKQMYVIGNIQKSDLNAIAVVGSRNMSDYGMQICEYFVSELAAAGVTIVSGLMYGVDNCAHQAAIHAGGRTLAVLGYGMNHLAKNSYAYPVAKDILDNKQGAILSEFDSNDHPQAWTFPRRNRIVASLSQAVLIVEATRKSGSIITADLVNGMGKEVFVIPGSIFRPNSEGKHMLLKEGAILVDRPQDIIQYYENRLFPYTSEFSETLSDEEIQIISIIKDGNNEVRTDDIASRTKIPIESISRMLTMLEINGKIKQNSAGVWQIPKQDSRRPKKSE